MIRFLNNLDTLRDHLPKMLLFLLANKHFCIIKKQFCIFKNVTEHRSERNKIISSQLTNTGELVKNNTAYCDKFLGNTSRNLIWNNIDYILYNVVRRAIAKRFDLAQGTQQATRTKKKGTLQYTTKIILIFQSRMNSKTAQQNTVKVPAAQFRIAYSPS